MKLALIQMNIAADKAANLAHAAELCGKAKSADVIMLPEMFCCPYRNRDFVKNAEEEGGAVTTALCEMAKASGAYLIGGSMPERDGEKLYNTSFCFDPAGRMIAKHRKVHLFDVAIEGGQKYRESRTFSPGESVTAFDTPFGKFGVIGCFDIRFPDMIRRLRDIDFLAVPAAFNMTTGPLHWELLFRARAVDEQIFTFGCAPARDESAPYVSYGNSIAVDPWGRVLARAGAEEQVLTVEIDPEEVRAVRKQIPVGKQNY
ncbi:MAG: carbon-nitrogen hydrolase family protein [Clostridia bacterium]|nr:carbon-nitrogen hydrolase family protein [Clostridia bacterium]